MDVAAALRPALEAAAATLGRVRIASERLEEPVAALDGLRDKGMFVAVPLLADGEHQATDRKSTRLNSSHANISYAVFCLKKKKQKHLAILFDDTSQHLDRPPIPVLPRHTPPARHLQHHTPQPPPQNPSSPALHSAKPNLT